MHISIFGVGYVGAVTSACLCDSGHHVIAVDKNKKKVACLQDGCCPIIEKDLDTLIAEHVKNGSLSATTDVKEAVQNSEISLICVGTPSHADVSLDLSYIEAVCEEIGEILKTKDEYHTVVLRSTMIPGSAHDVCLPILERISGKKAGIDFGFGNNPEFLREGTAVEDYYNPPKIVVGADDKKSGDIIMSLYDGIEASRIITDINIAEGVKYADNAWHAMKIGFANELGNILSDCGVDSHKVMDIFCQDKKLNISPAYLKPGFAFGGSCLPKDVRALQAKGKEVGVDTPLFNSLMIANDNQIERALNKIKALGKKNIALLGLSFKAGTDDLRESPLVTLAERLIKEGYNLKIYDPNVFQAFQMICGIQYNIPLPLSELLVETVDNVTMNSELFIIGNNGEGFSDIISNIKDENILILDLVRIDKNIEQRNGYNGLCW